MVAKGSLLNGAMHIQTRSRSVPDVVDTKFAVSLLAKLLIKCQRLPRVCLRNSTVQALLYLYETILIYADLT